MSFTQLVDGFDAARAADSALRSWNLMDGLPGARLAASDEAALGGDLAYGYGMSGTLAGISLGAALEVVGSVQFGSQMQTLRPWASLAGDLALFG